MRRRLLGSPESTSNRLETNREELDELTSIRVRVVGKAVGGATANGRWLILLRQLIAVFSRLKLLSIGPTGCVQVRLLLLKPIGLLVNRVRLGMKCTIALVSL